MLSGLSFDYTTREDWNTRNMIEEIRYMYNETYYGNSSRDLQKKWFPLVLRPFCPWRPQIKDQKILIYYLMI